MTPDLSRCEPALIDLPDRVVAALILAADDLRADQLMLVGARCRDILHSALGHVDGLALTSDLDIGLVLADIGAYEDIVRVLHPTGSSGIRYMLAGVPTDLMPFGEIEDPVGAVAPDGRGEPMSVWAFREVFAGSVTLTLPSGQVIRVPSVEGYAALKLAAWLDRSAYGEYKDARDLAICVHWYAESEVVESLLYETPVGVETLLRYDMDVRQSAAHLLGADIAKQIGPERVEELKTRWPGSLDLVSEFKIDPVSGSWPSDLTQRARILAAMASGWREVSF